VPLNLLILVVVHHIHINHVNFWEDLGIFHSLTPLHYLTLRFIARLTFPSIVKLGT